MTHARWTSLCCALVFLTGMTALVFQNTWHRYLTYLLGSQSQATAIIIAVFLGGMSVGYFVYGHLARHFQSSLYALYGATEFSIGVWALFSPKIYQAISAIPLGGFASEIGASILLIGVPTVLMGGTLPVLTQALSPDLTKATRTHSRIYGFNTFGAAFGSLFAGFYLLPEFGLPLTLFCNGMINILVGLIFYLGGRNRQARAAADVETQTAHPAPEEHAAPVRWLWIVAFISGFVTIGLETIMIRLFILSAGAFSYSFSVIVAIFVFCIALGGYLVGRFRSIPADGLPILLLCASFALVGLYRTVDSWPYHVHLLRTFFTSNPQTFGVYYASLFLAAGAVLLVPIAFCGATLPLCFHFVKRAREDLGSETGKLYAVNTVGCVLGALLPGFYLLQFFNLNWIFKILIFLVFVSFAVAVAYLWRRMDMGRRKIYLAVSMLLAIVVTLLEPWDNTYFARGLFQIQSLSSRSFMGREAMLWQEEKLDYYADGPAASVSVLESTKLKSRRGDPALAVQVDGKTDGNTHWDFYTMQLLGHLPALLSDKLDRVCVIGFGTGMTAGVVAQYKETGRVDLIEINPKVLEAGRLFEKYNYHVLESPKVSVVNTDAFRFFRSQLDNYDVIVSEPSNPWMAGVENLFTREFYSLAAERLKPGGVFMQWFHGYFLSDVTLRLILNTFQSVFPHLYLFQLFGDDYGIVGTLSPLDDSALERLAKRWEAESPANPALMDLQFRGVENFLALERAGRATTEKFAAGGGIHSLENPRLGYSAGRDFYINSRAMVRHMNMNEDPRAIGEVSLLQRWEKRTGVKSVISYPKLYCHTSVEFCRDIQVRNYMVSPEQGREYLAGLPEDEKSVLRSVMSPDFKPPSNEEEVKILGAAVSKHAMKHYTPNRLVDLTRHKELLDMLSGRSQSAGVSVD